jgi:flagellar protein FlgJ
MTAALNPVVAQGLAVDGNSLNALKFQAGKDSKAALKEAAKQFEALFMRELVKSMRQATAKSGLMDGDQGEDLATDWLDQQLATQMTGLPGGLSQAIERQLSRQMDPNAASSAPSAAAASAAWARGLSAYQRQANAAASTSVDLNQLPVKTTQAQADFVAKHAAAAHQVAAEVGIPASFMLGQAGHETGWGRSEIRNADGSPSFNLFGIKAGAGWSGKVTEVTTTEYVNGEARKVKAKFRAYDSYEDAFRDYARLVGGSARYQTVMQNLGSAQAFAAQLQKAGYATDPQYANKLSKAINTTMHLQRALMASRTSPAQQG